MPGNTVRLHRVFAAPPEKLYRAFTDMDALTKWMPPDGFYAKVESADVRIGGSYKMSFTNFTTGKSQSFGGTYKEIIPNEKLVYTDAFDDEALPGEIAMMITFKKVSVGTEVYIEQGGIPEAIPVEGCYLSWQQCLNALARLVEPEIKD